MEFYCLINWLLGLLLIISTIFGLLHFHLLKNSPGICGTIVQMLREDWSEHIVDLIFILTTISSFVLINWAAKDKHETFTIGEAIDQYPLISSIGVFECLILAAWSIYRGIQSLKNTRNALKIYNNIATICNRLIDKGTNKGGVFGKLIGFIGRVGKRSVTTITKTTVKTKIKRFTITFLIDTSIKTTSVLCVMYIYDYW